jgi:hypothetical protein
VSLEAEVPEALFDGMREFIRNHPQWDQYRLMQAALAGEPAAGPCCLLGGGEATVTLAGDGLGGRNTEFALAAAPLLASLGSSASSRR